MALGSATLAAGGVVTSCTRRGADEAPDPGQKVDVTLKTAAWPYAAMPSESAAADDPVLGAYREVLQTWLSDNPGVKLSAIEFEVWDQQALTTAVTGGTAPSFFPGNVLGGWNDTVTKSAFLQGLSADVTDVLDRYQLNDKIAPYARPIWDSWKVDGRYYAAPQGYGAGNGIYFRRDLINELGLREPEAGWTWSDLTELANGLTKGNRRGLAAQSYFLGVWLGSEGWSLLPHIPAPDTSWNWAYDYRAQADVWKTIIDQYRDMALNVKSIQSDIGWADGDVTAAFAQERAAMMPNNQFFMLGDPDTDNTPANLAKKLDKPLDDVVGWIQYPVGRYGNRAGTQPFMTVLGFDPDLDDIALDKAVSLHTYLAFGDGFVKQKQAIYEATEDLQKVWSDPTPLAGNVEIPGVPGSVAEAWGQRYADNVAAAAALPLIPNQSNFLPVEENPGPSSTAVQDATSAWMYEKGSVDVDAGLAKLTDTMNKQAGGFTSSASDDDFIAGARTYFEAVDAFWAEHAPDYSANVVRPWYERTVLPALGG
ncbi:ABC transporter substrate-binding protein [Microlunatus parietis]|uniref:ABC-type glycerol-3-phosphate transport system, substrate-binding protein n=1 Tax=Microlunatus parietis TaxID=682979 RepID=A0A7Y9ID01_9ACTN|nr:extracellular solute-binding protein [Microlunatus parietis]NYE74529.1 hypothetical protein [Microlunatus parietis]